MKNKENAFCDFMKMIEQSWTYAKMTDDERKRWNDEMIEYRCQDAIIGTYKQRWVIMNALYGMFLQGIGYTNHNWRSTENDLRIMF